MFEPEEGVFDEVGDVPVFVEPVLLELSDVFGESDVPLDEPVDEEPPELDVDVLSGFTSPGFASAELDSALDFLPRLSVLKNPLPLKVTPTGVNTFLTAMTSPVSGWAASVRVGSVNACWISIVSPVSTNLYT